MKHIIIGLALIATIAISAFAVASPASAHVELDSSSPAAGETLTEPPETVVLTFDGEIQRLAGSYSLAVTNAAGASVTASAPVLSDDGTVLSVTLHPDLPDGTYTVSWSNTSAEDGDAEEGEFTFAVGSAVISQPVATPVEEDHHDNETIDEHADQHEEGFAPPTTDLLVFYIGSKAGSVIDGRAEIKPIDGGERTQIGVYLADVQPNSAHATHVHIQASCEAEPGPHLVDLPDATAGPTYWARSLSVVNVPFSVVANGENVINVHAGATGGDKAIVACGAIPAQPAGAPIEADHGSRPVALPAAGTGSRASASQSWIVLAFVAGGALAIAGTRLRFAGMRITK